MDPDWRCISYWKLGKFHCYLSFLEGKSTTSSTNLENSPPFEMADTLVWKILGTNDLRLVPRKTRSCMCQSRSRCMCQWCRRSRKKLKFHKSSMRTRSGGEGTAGTALHDMTGVCVLCVCFFLKKVKKTAPMWLVHPVVWEKAIMDGDWTSQRDFLQWSIEWLSLHQSSFQSWWI